MRNLSNLQKLNTYLIYSKQVVHNFAKSFGASMEFSVGSKIKYVFPESINNKDNSFVGIIEFVGDTFFTARDTNNIILKISFKNFDNVKVIEEHDRAISYPKHLPKQQFS